jgi:hypothetical protein
LFELRENAALVGPVMLEVASGSPANPTRIEPVYLPALSVGRAQAFRSALICQLGPCEDAGYLQLTDGTGQKMGRLDLRPAAAGADAVCLGLGGVELDARPTTSPGAAPNVAGFDRALDTVRTALQRHNRSTDPTAVRDGLALYPDALRFFEEARASAAPADRIVSAKAAALAIRGIALPSEASGQWADIATSLGRVTLVEQMGAEQLLEVRALGLLLFRVFAGEAEVQDTSGVANVVSTSLQLAKLFPAKLPMLLDDQQHPLELAPWVQTAVSSAPPPALSDRLGTLQRFLNTYDRGVGNDRLLTAAARSFAHWARSGVVVAMGACAQRTIMLRRPGGIALSLGRDPLLA